MNIHRIILAVLVAFGVAGASMSILQVGTAEAQTPERINPEQVLGAGDVRLYNSLPPDIQSVIKNEIVPQLLAEARSGPLRGITGEAYDAEVRALVAFVVRAEKESQDALMRAMRSATPSVVGFMQIGQPASYNTKCTYTTSMGASGLVVYVAHVSSCKAGMAQISASVQLKGPGYTSQWMHQRNRDARSARAYTSHGYQSGTCWQGWGEGWATPRNSGPVPGPAGGSQQLSRCV